MKYIESMINESGGRKKAADEGQGVRLLEKEERKLLSE